jgi:hypothetical protein
MIKAKFLRLSLHVVLLWAVTSLAMGQGPTLKYLADPGTDLSWAHCYVYMEGGSRYKIPFLPLTTYQAAPIGTDKYSRDIQLQGPIVFAGNGIVKEGIFDCYGGIDVTGKIIMFSHDFPDSLHQDLAKEVSLEQRVREAAGRGALGIVIFSWEEENPFLFFKERNTARIPEIPAIAINRRAAAIILESGGRNSEDIFEKWQSKGEFESEVLISKLDLKIEGEFDRIETPNFTFCFQKGKFPTGQRSELAAVNERSVGFILELFKEVQLNWEKTFTAYFPDYDSKLFYVQHWGRGLSCDAGVFMVFDGTAPDFPLAVHENTHSLLGQNWGGTSSFMTEGMGKYSEAMASDKDKNHREIIDFLKASKLVPLSKLVTLNIGSAAETPIAYPAAGSFVQYLRDTYSLGEVKAAYQLEGREKNEAGSDTWQTVFGKSLRELEKEWLLSLAASHQLEKRYVEKFLASFDE